VETKIILKKRIITELTKEIVDSDKIMKETSEGIIVLDKDFTCLFINDKATEISRKSKTCFLQQKITDVFPDITNSRLFYKLTHSSQVNHQVRYVEDVAFPGSKKGYYEIILEPISTHILLRFIDLAESNQKDLNLLQIGPIFQSLFDNLLNGLAFCKIIYKNNVPDDFEFILVNKAFETLTGLHSIKGKKASEVIPEIQKYDQSIIAKLGTISRSGKPEMFEFYLKSMQIWLCLSVYSPERDHIIAIFDVITEKKTEEIKLHEQLEELRRWYKVSIDREERLIELMQEVNQLLLIARKTPRYSEIK
jgi:PAS domain-containing protein